MNDTTPHRSLRLGVAGPVGTGHTAIRDDVTMNLLAVEDLERDVDPLDIVLVESGGDNLTATFSPSFVDAQLFVLDVAGGGDVARKGGPGISRADLLVVNKIDLAEHVDVDVDRMLADASEAREGRAVVGVPQAPRDCRGARAVGARDAQDGHRGRAHPAGSGPDGAALPRRRGRPGRLPAHARRGRCRPHPLTSAACGADSSAAPARASMPRLCPAM